MVARYAPRALLRDARIDILTAMRDPNLFGQHFRNTADWETWRAFFSSPIWLITHPAPTRPISHSVQAAHSPPPNGATEAWLVVGRRGGKSFMLATIACYLACFKDWRRYLGPGERGTIMVIAADRKQGAGVSALHRRTAFRGTDVARADH